MTRQMYRPLSYVLPILVVACGVAAAQGNINTIAGGGTFVFPNGPLPATQAPLSQIASVTADANGNIFAGDLNNHVVIKIAANGTMVAYASIQNPWSLATDSAGNVFVLDVSSGGGVGILRKIDPSGGVTTIPDGGMSSPHGIATDAAGNLYVTDGGYNRIKKITPSGVISTVAGSDTNAACRYSGDGGPATQAGFCDPYGVLVDRAGSIYISEAGNSRIRKITPDGIINTIAGNGTRGFSGDGGAATTATVNWPFGRAIDSTGNLYFADWQNNRVRVISASGIISTIAGGATINFTGDGGPAVASLLNMPQSLAIDAAGNLYISDTVNSRVRKIDRHGVITTLAGNGAYKVSGDGGPVLQASFYSPNSVVVDRSGNMYVSDTSANRVRKISTSGTITTIAGYSLGYAGDGGPATSALLNSPSQLALDSAGNLYIADAGNGRIRKVDVNGNISTVAGGGANSPGDGGPATAALLSYPGGVAVDSTGNLYIAEALGGRLRKVDSSGAITTLLQYLQFPTRVALDSAGRVYVGTEAFQMSTRDGGVTRINADGTQTSVARGFIDPSGFAFDSTGTLYVSENFGGSVVRVGANLTNTIIAGTGTPGFSGDGGPAVAAQLSSPAGLAFDATGALLVVDSGNARMRRIVGPSCTGAPEPQVQMTLPAGFYIAEVRNAPGTGQGYWGMTVNVNQGVISGGFNLGGAIKENNGPPGYGAFYVPQSGPVTIQIGAQVMPGGDPSQFSMVAHILDSNRQEIGSDQLGTTSIQFTPTLAPGFYILEVRTAPSAPRATFQTSFITSSISGGVNAGGFVADGIVGFGAFYVPQSQGVTLQPFGPSNGTDGASCVQLTLLDANRKVIATAP